MREILFRGKCNETCKYNGQWIEGFYGEDDGKPIIAHSTDRVLIGYFCEPDSIGQYTGLTDKNGNKIFEGDILKAIHYFRGSMDEFKKKKIRKAYGKAMENKNSYLEEFTYFRNYAVEYSAKKCAWIGRNGSDQHELKSLTNCFHKGAVIGNIHDNPELLEVIEE